MVTAGGGGIGLVRCSIEAGSWYGRRRGTWKTGCIRRSGGSSNLYATGDILVMMVYGPMKRCCNFLEVRRAWDARLTWYEFSNTLSPTLNSTSRRDLFAFLS